MIQNFKIILSPEFDPTKRDPAERRTVFAAAQSSHAIGHHLMSITSNTLKLNVEPFQKDIERLLRSLREKLPFHRRSKDFEAHWKHLCKELLRLCNSFYPLRGLVVDLDLAALAWTVAFTVAQDGHDHGFDDLLMRTKMTIGRLRKEENLKIMSGERPRDRIRLNTVHLQLEKRLNRENMSLHIELPALPNQERDLAAGKRQVMGMYATRRDTGLYELV